MDRPPPSPPGKIPEEASSPPKLIVPPSSSPLAPPLDPPDPPKEEPFDDPHATAAVRATNQREERRARANIAICLHRSSFQPHGRRAPLDATRCPAAAVGTGCSRGLRPLTPEIGSRRFPGSQLQPI